jgi:GNAT superfamily N-acetyltransferase
MSEHTEGPRACGKYELGPTLDLLNRVFFPEQAGMGHFGPHLACEENRENLRVLLVGRRVVAHAGLYVSEMMTPRGDLRLGGVWGVACDPDWRRRGYGEACVRDAMLRMDELGCDLGWLGTGIFDWYRRFGWERAGPGYEFELDGGNMELLPRLEGCRVQVGLGPDLEEQIALHAADRLGVRRRPELWPVLLGDRHVRGETFTATHEGRLVAYAQVNERGQVMEHAGEAETVAGLVGEIWRRRESAGPASTTNRPGQMTVETPVVNRGLGELLRGLNLPHRFSDRGMLWVVNLESLLHKLGLAEKVSAERIEGGWRLRRGAETAEIPDRHLVKLLFGPERVSPFAPDLFPLEFYHWTLDMV